MSINRSNYASYFKWTIHPPFFPGETMHAKFHHESLSAAQWLVKLQFVEREFGFWNFLLTLQINSFWIEENQTILANKIAVRIGLNEKSLLDRRVSPYVFNIDNRYEFYEQTSASLSAQTGPFRLQIEIGITLQDDVINEMILQRRPTYEDDLRRLAKDLGGLVLTSGCYNMDLHSKEDYRHSAHSYVLYVRWKKLLDDHGFDITSNTVIRTNISSRVLLDLLMYMYSGIIKQNWPYWSQIPYVAELLQVVEQYKIYHLHDVIDQSDSSQIRESKKSSIAKSYEFRLLFKNDGPVNDGTLNLTSQEIATTPGTQFHQSFVLQIQVKKLKRAGPWLSYSIRSQSELWAGVQVNFELVKSVASGSGSSAKVRTVLVHTSYYSVQPKGCVESGPILFLGCLETFGGFTTPAAGNKISQWFRFSISFMDGSLLDNINSFNNSKQRRMIKYHVLSNHMYQMMSLKVHADTHLESRPDAQTGVKEMLYLHAGILRSRISQSNGALTDLQQGPHFPKVMAMDVSPDAMPYVVDYIYTGKLVNVPQHLYDEIHAFANRIMLEPLKNRIAALRRNLITRRYLSKLDYMG